MIICTNDLSIIDIVKKSILFFVKTPLFWVIWLVYCLIEFLTVPLMLELLLSLPLDIIVMIEACRLLSGNSIKDINITKIIATDVLVILIVLLGFVLLIIPGLIFFCLLSVAIPISIFENKGAIDSIKESIELTKNYRLIIFVLYGVILLLYCILLIFDMFIMNTIVPDVSIFSNLMLVFIKIITLVLYLDLKKNVKNLM